MRIAFYEPSTLPQTCRKCGEIRPAEDFAPKGTNLSGRRYQCKYCVRLYYREYKRTHADRIREKNKTYPHNTQQKRQHRIKHLYGLTNEDYERLLVEQVGACAICHRPPLNDRFGKLSVDHDHLTEKVRGLLCDNCNNMLGRAQDDPDVLQAAISYLKKHGTT